MLRNALHHHDISQRLDYLGTAPTSFRTHQQAFSGVLIEQVQHPHRPPVMRLRAHEVVAPDMIGAFGT